MEDCRKMLRQQVWSTTLGVRAKLILLSMVEIAEIEGPTLSFENDFIFKMCRMHGRKASSIVANIERLQEQGILFMVLGAPFLAFEFHPENEVKYQGKSNRKKVA